MPISSATVPTAHASRYLQQLCRHWAHKFQVAFTAEEGRIVLPENTVATLKAGELALGVRLEAQDGETLERMKGVLARHVDRFAFREAPLPFDWRDEG